MNTLSLEHLRSRTGKVCVALSGTRAELMLDDATSLAHDLGFIEFRLDALLQPAAELPRLEQFLGENASLTTIATCRRTKNGGGFPGTVEEELEMLLQAAAAGFHIVDLELESAESLSPADLDRLRSTDCALLISYHNYASTPDLDSIHRRILSFHPDFIKIVPTAESLSDNLKLIHFLERNGGPRNLVGICMGEAGIVSRVLAPRFGAVFTFASVGTGQETAPGQIDARTLLDTYRIDSVDTATGFYGVAGNPVKSSLSPLMLNSAFRRESINAVYFALQTTSLADLLHLVKELPLHGLSVTMPFKQAILPYLEEMDPLTTRIGACNTILRAADGKLYGFNTDVAGIVGPLERRMPLRGAKVLVLGAGGAARAAVFGLRDKEADVFILNRTPETAQKLAEQAGAKVIERESLPTTAFDIVVNATPVGMAGQNAASPLEEKELNANLVFDLVYNPLETPLLRQARQQGISVVTGVEMFVHQGARQFEIWTGKAAPEEEMIQVVLHALKQRAG